MFCLMNIIIVFTYKTRMLQVIYYLNNILNRVHNSDLPDLIPCTLYITSTPFRDTTVLTYEIEFPTSGKKTGFNSLNYEDFTIQYITDTIPN